MNKEETVGFEEIHITKRQDGKGFALKAKGTFNGEPSTIEIPMLQQPHLTINTRQDNEYLFGKLLYNFCREVRLEFNASIKPENNIYYNVTIDPEYHAKKQAEKLEREIEELIDKSVKEIVDKRNMKGE